MGKVKKLTALLLAAVMVLAMGIVSFAAPATSGNLTVNVKDGKNLTGQNIYIFKLFDLESTDPSVYTVNSTYTEALKEVLSVADAGEDGYNLYSAIAALGEDNAAQVQNFANAFTKKVINNGEVTGTKEIDYWTSGKLTETNKDSYTFNNVAAGYYLVYLAGSTEIQSSLVTVNGDQSVNLKSETPEISKEAKDTDTHIGEVVEYTVKTKVPDIAGFNPDNYKFIVKDTLSDGLDFVKDSAGTALEEETLSISVKITDADPAVEQNIDATVTGRSMTLDLSDFVKAQQSNKGKEIVITYYAKVNKDAVVVNGNEVKIEYTNDPSSNETTETIPGKEDVYTFPVKVHKYEAGKDEAFLAGAKFELYYNKEVEDEDQIDTDRGAIKVEGSDGKYTVKEDQTSGTTEMTTVGSALDEGGYNLYINGLESGTYWLKETDAPEGFNAVEPIKIVITNKGDGEYSITVNDGDAADAPDDIVKVENKKGTILPGTGGIGTVIFTAVGVILIAAVGVSFVISRKRTDA